jgi:hypothetical protein
MAERSHPALAMQVLALTMAQLSCGGLDGDRSEL